MLKEQFFRNPLALISQPKTLNLREGRGIITGVKYVLFGGFRDLRRLVGGNRGRRSAINGDLWLGER